MRKTGVKLVADRRGHLIAETGVPSLERFDPIASHQRVFDFGDDPAAVGITTQKPKDGKQCRFAGLHQSHEGVP